jgi:hypothetical protein
MVAITGLVPNLVEAPPVGPLRYGVFNVARITELSGIEAGRLWGAGYSFLTDHCDGASVYDDACDVTPTKPFTEGSDLMEADPFRILSKKHCGTVGRTANEMEAAVRQQLISGEQTVVESVIWDGDGLAAHSPTLTSSGATVVTPLAAGAGAAIAALENAAYQTMGYVGVIHINQQAYAALMYANILRQDGNIWRTALGTAVSFGAGYDITGPDDVAPAAGFVYAFMTSALDMRRTDIRVPDVMQTLDRINNQWEVVAERAYAFTWDCPETFAVQVPVAAPATAADVALPA